MYINQANRDGGKISTNGIEVEDAINVSGGNSSTEGILIIHEDKPIFIPTNTTKDLLTIVDTVLELIELMFSITPTPPLPPPPLGYPTKFITQGTLLSPDSSVKLLSLMNDLDKIKKEFK